MNLEPYAPAASLLLLGLMALVAFARVRVLMKRHGLAELHPEQKTAGHAQPWWAAHLDDYTREPVAVPAAKPQVYRPERERRAQVVAPRPVPEPGEALPVSDEGAYVLAAPVELWFGDSRVAVRPGSDTDARFQRFAKVLLDDLRSAHERV